MGRFSCLILLLAAVISGCGSSGDEKKAAPEYAATPRKALESRVTAVLGSTTTPPGTCRASAARKQASVWVARWAPVETAKS
jgi:hypothetical protein